MKNPVTKLAAAAVVVVGLGLLIGLLTHTATPAYALDQTVEANQSLRFIHIKDFVPEHEDAPKEFWIACDRPKLRTCGTLCPPGMHPDPSHIATASQSRGQDHGSTTRTAS